MTQYCRESEFLTIYYTGTQICLPKPNTKKCRHQVLNAVLTNSGLGSGAIQQAEMGETVAASDN